MWKGKVPASKNTDLSFEQFDTMENGVRAGLYVLSKYIIDYGLVTIPQIIARFCPDNSQYEYCRFIYRNSFLRLDTKIDTQNKLFVLARQMMKLESLYVCDRDMLSRAFMALPSCYINYFKV